VISKAKGELVGALDADSFVDRNALKAIVSRFDDPNTMAVTPSMKIHNARNLLEIIQEIEFVIGIFLRKVFAFVGSIHVTPGPFSIYRKKFFEKHGGYDENNLTEDIEIALRIQSKGYHIENTLHALVYTVAPKTFLSLLKQRLRWYYGFIMNVEKYKHLFHVKTGNLGIIIMPAAFVSIFLIIFSLGYTLFKFLESLLHFFSDIIALGWEYFRLFTFKIDIFTLLDEVTILVIVTLLISAVIIVLANKMSHKNKYIAVRFVVFSLFYWILFGFWWFMAFMCRFTGRKLNWGHKAG
jgi:cellulose synthase/poly-beta-1,6-N-acetylglucosamine synthase-like glycosyltransferase